MKRLGIGCVGIVVVLLVIGVIANAVGGNKGGSVAATSQTTTSPAAVSASSARAATTNQATSLAAVTTSSSTHAVTPTPVPAVAAATPIGKTISVKNWDVTVTGVQKPGKKLVWSDVGNSSNAIGTWLVVALDLKNTGKQNFGVNSFDFKLKDASGASYDTSNDLGAIGYSEYKGGITEFGAQVPPGVDTKIYLVFDVSPTAKGLQLQFVQDTNPVFALGQ